MPNRNEPQWNGPYQDPNRKAPSRNPSFGNPSLGKVAERGPNLGRNGRREAAERENVAYRYAAGDSPAYRAQARRVAGYVDRNDDNELPDYGQRYGASGSGADFDRNNYASHGREGNFNAGSWGDGYYQPYVGGYPYRDADPSQSLQRESDFRAPVRSRGVKGYKRSDERIREDLCDRLMDRYSGIDASDVEITVSQGEITLTGTVPNRGTKLRIEAIADSIRGTLDVHNHLRVARDAAFQ